MTECNGCGACCNPVMLPFTQDDARRAIPSLDEHAPSLLGQTMQADDRRWILEDLEPIPFREGLALRPELRGRSTMRPGPDGFEDAQMFFYRCRHYDTDTRACLAYEARPPVCTGFPWYGNNPHPAATIPPACEFQLDVGRTPVPVDPPRRKTL